MDTFWIPAFVLDHSITVLVITAVMILAFFLQGGKKTAPGPRYIPFLGIIPDLVGNVTGPLLTKWAEDANSNILCLKILGIKVAVISSYDYIHEHYVKRADLSDRQEVNIVRVLDPEHCGIVLSSGEVWQESRQITLRRMRDLGMGTSSGQQYITEEAEILVKTFQESNGEPINLKPSINQAVANVVSVFAFGKRFDYSDPKFQNALECINNFNAESGGPVGQIVLPFRVGRWIYREKWSLIKALWAGMTEFVDDQITEHEERFDGTVADLTDAFLADNRDGKRRFTRNQIKANLLEMLSGGTDTTTIQLQWLLLYMARYQLVQEKVYQEIEGNIGNKSPSMMDKKSTPYTEATVNEVMRMNTLLFTGVPRTNNSQDFEIGGYKFKKGTPVIANYWSVHNDPDLFPNPSQFDPGHFLTVNGRVKNLDKMVSFTLGRRSCAGESLARNEIYLFFVMFIQKFEIRAPEGTEVDLTPIRSSLHEPKDLKIQLIPRSAHIE